MVHYSLLGRARAVEARIVGGEVNTLPDWNAPRRGPGRTGPRNGAG